LGAGLAQAGVGFRTVAVGNLIVLQRTPACARPALHVWWGAPSLKHWFIFACRTGRVGFRTTACGSLIVLQRTRPVRQAVAHGKRSLPTALSAKASTFYAHKSVIYCIFLRTKVLNCPGIHAGYQV
jgi:hypothetical protein